ncbi:alpha/beta fold hydrolase [Sagittula sp. SSi028]|uniref:alpha/beta fold hydrolase n=1 Tax=Sagittula sp. SSi028 TaxID=3400636 RepID=UPI003AF6FFF6
MPEDQEFNVDGLTYAARVWGPQHGQPVLALHGWMDHADSFGRLAPLLPECRIVALDLSGQGLSSLRAPHATYNIWDDLPQLVAVLDQLGWDKPVVLGHSRGAIIGALLAAAVPDRVGALVALDALVPEPRSTSFADTLGQFVTQSRQHMARGPRVFADTAEYAARRHAQGASEETATALAPRALRQTDDGFVLRGDRRLFASSAVKLTREDAMDVLRAIRCPVLNVWASDGIAAHRSAVAELADWAAKTMAAYTSVTVPGDHHVHLSATGAPLVAAQITRFLAQM